MKLLISLATLGNAMSEVLPRMARTATTSWNRVKADRSLTYTLDTCYGRATWHLTKNKPALLKHCLVVFLGTERFTAVTHVIIIDRHSGQIVVDSLGKDGYLSQGQYVNNKHQLQTLPVLHVYEGQVMQQAFMDLRANGSLPKIAEASANTQTLVRRVQ
jgi:hypothetical protein